MFQIAVDPDTHPMIALECRGLLASALSCNGFRRALEFREKMRGLDKKNGCEPADTKPGTDVARKPWGMSERWRSRLVDPSLIDQRKAFWSSPGGVCWSSACTVMPFDPACSAL